MKAKAPGSDEDGPSKPLDFALQNLDTAHPYLAERGLSAETIAEFGLGDCQNGNMTGRAFVPIHNAERQLVTQLGLRCFHPAPLSRDDCAASLAP